MIEKLDKVIAEFEAKEIERERMLILIRRDAFIELAQEMRISAEEAAKSFDRSVELWDLDKWGDGKTAGNVLYCGIRMIPWVGGTEEPTAPFAIGYSRI